MSWWAWILIGLVALLVLIIIGLILAIAAAGKVLADGLDEYLKQMLWNR